MVEKVDNKKLSAVEQLDRDHAAAQKDRAAALDAAMTEVREADKLARETKSRVAQLQQERLAASLAYDAKRAELVAAEKAAAKAA